MAKKKRKASTSKVVAFFEAKSPLTKREIALLAVCRHRVLRHCSLMMERVGSRPHEELQWDVTIDGRVAALPPFVQHMLEEAYQKGRDDVGHEVRKAIGAERP